MGFDKKIVCLTICILIAFFLSSGCISPSSEDQNEIDGMVPIKNDGDAVKRVKNITNNLHNVKGEINQLNNQWK